MRKVIVAAALAAMSTLVACKKTGEGEYQVKTPDVNVSTDTHTVETPSAEVRKDTVTTEVPKVRVKTPEERKAEKKT